MTGTLPMPVQMAVNDGSARVISKGTPIGFQIVELNAYERVWAMRYLPNIVHALRLAREASPWGFSGSPRLFDYAVDDRGNWRVVRLVPTPLTVAAETFYIIPAFTADDLLDIITLAAEWDGPVYGPRPTNDPFIVRDRKTNEPLRLRDPNVLAHLAIDKAEQVNKIQPPASRRSVSPTLATEQPKEEPR